MASMKLGEKVIVGAGGQVNFSRIVLKNNPSFATPNENSTVLKGEDYAFGWTAGLIVLPIEGTRLGVGYRSKISLNLEGDVRVAGDEASGLGIGNQIFTPIDIHADLPLPEVVTVSLVQEITQNTRIMATYEWTNWSKLGNVPIVAQSTGGLLGLPAAVVPPFTPGRTVTTLEFGWNDGHFYSLGGELDINDRLTIRTGTAWEEAPVDNATQRSTAVPDSDRIWVSGGGTFAYNERISIDLAYSHLFYAKGPIERRAAVAASSGNPGAFAQLTGVVETSVDIIAASVKMKLGGTEN